MSYEIRSLDIAKVKCDVIINSLGVDTDVYGAICRNIVKAAKSNELTSLISSWKSEARPGKIFLSKGFNLPSKNIIHVVTPFFSHDDQLYALEYVYKVVLMTALKKGWKDIAIPIIGTGANGYPHSYVLKMVSRLVSAFSETYKNVHVTICMPVVSIEDYDSKFDPKELDKSIKEYFKINSKLDIREFEYDEFDFERLDRADVEFLLDYSALEINEVRYLDIKRKYNQREFDESLICGGLHIPKFLDELEVLLESGKRPVDFDMSSIGLLSVTTYIETYINERFSNESDRKMIRRHVNEIVSGANDSTSLKAKHNNEDRRTTITLPMLMRYILALHMTRKEADNLLLFCGKIFSPVGKQDKIYISFIKMKKYDVYEVNGLCIKENIEPIFGYIK